MNNDNNIDKIDIVDIPEEPEIIDIDEQNPTVNEEVLDTFVKSVEEELETTASQKEVLKNSEISDDEKPNSNYSNDSSNEEKRNIFKCLIIGIIFAVIGVGCALTYYFISNDPTNYYKELSKKVVDKVYKTTYFDDNIYKKSIGLDFKLTTDVIDTDTLNLINNTTLKFDLGVDKNNKKAYFSLDSDYSNESLLDASFFLSENENKLYLYLKDYLDKYIEMDSDGKQFESLFKTSLGKTSNLSKAKKIIKKEVISQIESSKITKKDGYFVYTISNTELVSTIKKVISNLSNNEDFLKCYSDRDSMKKQLESIILYMNSKVTVTNEQTIKIYVKKKGIFNNSLKEVIIESNSTKITFDFSSNIYKFNLNLDNEILFSGTYTSKKSKNNKDITITFDVPKILTFELKINSKYEKLKKLEFVDDSKVVKTNEITQNDINDAMNKLSQSKLYSIISQFGGADFLNGLQMMNQSSTPQYGYQNSNTTNNYQQTTMLQ